MKFGDKFYSHKELERRVGNISQIGGTRHYELIEGRSKGVSAIEVNTGSGFCFTVLPDRGLDISRATYKGINLVYRTPNGEVNPAFYEPQPYSARNFMIKYQDSILFGVDMPISPEVYRCYFRFLETRDEYFDYPDYMGRWGYSRWKIYGLHLPDDVLKKIYFQNISKIIPGIDLF